MVRAYGWEWSDVGGPRGREPAAVVRHLPRRASARCCCCAACFPALETAGSLLFLAVGIAFLVSWLVNRGVGSLYLGAIITALAAPGPPRGRRRRRGGGVGTLCLGVAFLFIAAVRRRSGGGWGWQAGAGRDPRADRRVEHRDPGFNDLVWPIVLVVLGGCSCSARRAPRGPDRDPRRRRPRRRRAGAQSAGDRRRSASSSASPSPSAIRTSSSSVTTNGGPSRTMSPSTPFAFPVPE